MVIDDLFLLVLPALVLFHLAAAPATKVEESFNLQAIHDLLAYPPWSAWKDAAAATYSTIPDAITAGYTSASAYLHAHYDHVAFPGAVPRTFIGALALAGAAAGVLRVLPGCVARHLVAGVAGVDGSVDGSVDGMGGQLLVRGLLGIANAGALAAYGRGVRAAHGRLAGMWWVIFVAGQFHVLFYASRTLPNTFAFPLITFALRLLLPDGSPSCWPIRAQAALALLAAAAVIFRAELVLLLLAQVVYLTLTHRLRLFWKMISAVVIGSGVSVVATVVVDSFFWGRLLWPEMAAFVFNVLHGQAAAGWGRQPAWWYFTVGLPRVLGNPAVYLLCIPVALVGGVGVIERIGSVCFSSRNGSAGPGKFPRGQVADTAGRARDLVLPAVMYVSLYSLQPHKEWRFVVYVAPTLTAAGALGAANLTTAALGKKKEKKEREREVGKITSREGSEPTKGRSQPMSHAKLARLARLVPLALLAILAVSTLATFALQPLLLAASAANYPGAAALKVLHDDVARDLAIAQQAGAERNLGDGDDGSVSEDSLHVHIYMDTLTCQTGVTHFLETPGVPGVVRAQQSPASPADTTAGTGATAHSAPDTADLSSLRRATIHYDRTEFPAAKADPAFWSRFQYALLETGTAPAGGIVGQHHRNNQPSTETEAAAGGRWAVVASVRSFAGVRLLRPGMTEFAGERTRVTGPSLSPSSSSSSATNSPARHRSATKVGAVKTAAVDAGDCGLVRAVDAVLSVARRAMGGYGLALRRAERVAVWRRL